MSQMTPGLSSKISSQVGWKCDLFPSGSLPHQILICLQHLPRLDDPGGAKKCAEACIIVGDLTMPRSSGYYAGEQVGRAKHCSRQFAVSGRYSKLILHHRSLDEAGLFPDWTPIFVPQKNGMSTTSVPTNQGKTVPCLFSRTLFPNIWPKSKVTLGNLQLQSADVWYPQVLQWCLDHLQWFQWGDWYQPTRETTLYVCNASTI